MLCKFVKCNRTSIEAAWSFLDDSCYLEKNNWHTTHFQMKVKDPFCSYSKQPKDDDPNNVVDISKAVVAGNRRARSQILSWNVIPIRWLSLFTWLPLYSQDDFTYNYSWPCLSKVLWLDTLFCVLAQPCQVADSLTSKGSPETSNLIGYLLPECFFL